MVPGAAAALRVYEKRFTVMQRESGATRFALSWFARSKKAHVQ
jgi:hypothetical protein